MIQHIIKGCIHCLKGACDCLEEAYEATYMEISKSFNAEIERRKKENKKKFFSTAKAFVKKRFKEETGETMPDSIAQKFAETFFDIATKRGDVDALNVLKNNIERSNNE